MGRRLFHLFFMFVLLSFPSVALAASANNGLFSVTGVEVDVTDKDASTARTKAIIAAQVKAFQVLAERLASESDAKRLEGMSEQDIGRMLRSLSIEEEHSAPGRYIGKLTVRFLPKKVREQFQKRGIALIEDQAPPTLILPVWKASGGPQLWDDNLWRKAWLDLKAEQGIVPLIVPLGDLEDTQSITAEEAMALDQAKLEALMIRYEAKAILVALAEPAPEGGIHAVMMGDSPLGKVTFDKVYTAEDGTLESSAALAAKRFQGVMLDKWRSTRLKVAAEQRARAEAERQQTAAYKAQSVAVAVPFSGIDKWNSIRARLLNVPGVVGIDISTIAATGAVIRLAYTNSFEALQSSLAGNRMKLVQMGGSWVLQPM
jgi:hypothetical protein